MPFKNPEMKRLKQREYGKAYRLRHLEAVRARDREKKRLWWRSDKRPRKGTPEYQLWTDKKKASQAKRRSQNLEKARERDRLNSAKWRQKNPERFKAFWQAVNVARPNRYVEKYGITEQQYRDMVAAQGGRCSICFEKPQKRFLDVDHDHATGAVRGLLCQKCNRGLGQFKDSAVLLATAVMYLSKHQQAAKCS